MNTAFPGSAPNAALSGLSSRFAPISGWRRDRVRNKRRFGHVALRVDYLRPAELREFLCEARVTRMGNRVASVDIVAFHADDPERLIATGKAVYSIKRRE